MITKVEFHAMGSHMLAALEADSATARVLHRVPGWFAAWEESLSRFQPESELNRLNRSNSRAFKTSRVLWQVLQLSLNTARESEGLITPEVLGSLEALGYDRSFENVWASSNELDFTPGAISSRLVEIRLDKSTRSVVLPAGMRLDLGGVAKGWAACQAMLRLKKFGPALVNAGGDIAISGALTDGKAWPVGIRDPFDPKRDMLTLNLSDRSVATSGRDYHKWFASGIWQHHIIDPRSGAPARTDVMTATVIASGVMRAEMLAKMLFILGSTTSVDWLEQHQQYAACLVLENGDHLYSPTFHTYQGLTA